MKIIFDKYGGIKDIQDRKLLVQSSIGSNFVDIYYQDEEGNFADPDINLATITFKRADTFEISERTCALVKEELTNNPLYFRYILKEDELAINGELQMTVRLKQVVFDPEDDSKVLLIKQRAMGKITAHIYEAIGENYENFDVVDGRILQLELWQANFESDYYNADQIDAKLVLERQATNDSLDDHNASNEAHEDIRQSIENLDNTLQEQIDTINGTLSEHDFRINELEDFASNLEIDITEEIEQALGGKADLVDGKVPLEQLPDMEITKQKVEDVLTGDITSHNHATEIGNHNSSGTSHSDIRTAINNLQSAITTLQNIIGTVGEDDENEVIDKLQEVFKVLEDFEEDSNLVSILANKVDIDDLPIVIGYLSSGVFYKDSGLTQAITGSTSKIYIDIKESNKKIYWFNGTVYEEISKRLEIGTLATQAFRGDLGQIAYEHSQSTHAPSNAQKNSDITKAEIEAKLTGEISSHSHSYNNLDDKPISVIFEITSFTELTPLQKTTITNQLMPLLNDDLTDLDTNKYSDLILKYFNQRYHYSSVAVDDGEVVRILFDYKNENTKIKLDINYVGDDTQTVIELVTINYEPEGTVSTHNTSETAHSDIRQAIPTKTSDLTNDSGFLTSLPTHNHDDRYYTESEIDTKLDGKANSSHTHTKSEITDFPTIPTIPDITVNNGSAESGKYISQIAVDATNKHKLNITKENLPTLRPTIELEVASLTTLTELEKLTIKNQLSSLIVDDKIDGTKFDDIVLVTTSDLIRLHYSSIDYYVANPQITVIFETQDTKYRLHVPLIDYTYSTLTSTTTTIPTISTSITTDATSDTKTASPKAVKTYVDNALGDIETLLEAI